MNNVFNKLLKLCILVLIFFSNTKCFGLMALSDEDMDTVVGYAGVSISIDDIKLYKKLEYLIYRDNNGEDYTYFDAMAGNSLAGEIILEDIEIGNVYADAIVGNSILGRDAHFHSTDSQYLNNILFHPLSIDITENVPKTFWKDENQKFTGMVLGLPSLNIYLDKLSIENIRTHSVERSSWNDNYSMDGIYIDGLNLAILDGIVEILPHSRGGISVALDDIRLFISIDGITYEDHEGLYNPINDEFDNFYSDISPSASIPHPARLTLKDVKFDLININSFVYYNNGGKLTLHSFGMFDVSPLLTDMKNLHPEDVPLPILELGGSPLTLDVTEKLPTTTKVYNARGKQGTAAGLFIGLPTIDISCNSIVIGGIYFDDPKYPQDPNDPIVLNDNTSFLRIQSKDVDLAILSGYIEVSPK